VIALQVAEHLGCNNNGGKRSKGLHSIIIVAGMMLPSGMTYPQFRATLSPELQEEPLDLQFTSDGKTSTVTEADALRCFFQDWPDQSVAKAAAHRLTAQPTGGLAIAATYDASDNGAVACIPKLYIEAKLDGSVKLPVQRAMQGLFANRNLRIVSMETGHVPHVVQPTVFCRYVCDFLSSLSVNSESYISFVKIPAVSTLKPQTMALPADTTSMEEFLQTYIQLQPNECIDDDLLHAQAEAARKCDTGLCPHVSPLTLRRSAEEGTLQRVLLPKNKDSIEDDSRIYLYYDESAHFKKRPLNARATEWVKSLLTPDDGENDEIIHGDVYIVRKSKEGQIVSLDEKEFGEQAWWLKQLTVSAPGKLLLAGGYLVLESPNIGVVIAVDKRFYCTTELLFLSKTTTPVTECIHVEVSSVQFGLTWNYVFNKKDGRLEADVSQQSQNLFVERTVRVCLLALLEEGNFKTISRIRLTLKGDNDFYSLVPHLHERGMAKTLKAAMSLPPFLPVVEVNGKVLKSGLGSSACLVTSIVASLWCCITGDQITTCSNTIFRLAQICHSFAQGKIGSGFDVAAACYGTHLYQRFPKSLLTGLLTSLEHKSSSKGKLQTDLQSILQAKWDGGICAPFCLPLFLEVMLADVSGGSESPSMARKVLEWKKSFENETGTIPHWDNLTEINLQIADLLQHLSTISMDETRMESLITTHHSEWERDEVGKVLLDFRRKVQESRSHLKAMGEAAGVPIEPNEQTELVDATLTTHGVIAALVPGAGGYDAIACIYLNHPKVRQAIADVWCSWTKASVCPLTVQAAPNGQGLMLEP
jgi:phosphomevalonate kinase